MTCGARKGETTKGFNPDDVRQIKESLDAMKNQVSDVKHTIVFDWCDKKPEHALAEGNYSGCCVAFNGGNKWTLPLYMKDYGLRIVEIKDILDNGEERNVGQAWLMTGFDREGVPVMIVDSIELSADYRTNAIESAAFKFIKDISRMMGFGEIATISKHREHIPDAERKRITNTIYRWKKRAYSDFKNTGWVAEL